ncbi:plasmid segregation protein ParM domain-containing protein [Escherichia coli]
MDRLSADAVVTTETRYQYSDVNVVAIQHALTADQPESAAC